MDEVAFVSIGYAYHLRLSKKYVTKKRLEALFDVDDAIVVTREGDELEQVDGIYNDLAPTKIYMVASEKDLAAMEDDESKEPIFYPGRLEKMALARRQMIQELYVPLHPHLWNLTDDLFEPSFLKMINDYNATKDPNQVFNILKKKTPTRIYSFLIFKQIFCLQLIEEVENFEKSGLPVSRPNSMNNYGVILDEIGFKPFFDRLTEKILPVTSLLYPDYFGGALDSHHAFIVQYKISEDLNLDFHYDSSEVTLNLCLGKQFTGGSLYFSGLLDDKSTHDENFEFNHVPGLALLHIGKHRHGANSILSGERYNLIVWFTNKENRKIEEAKQREHQHCHHHDHSHGHAHGDHDHGHAHGDHDHEDDGHHHDDHEDHHHAHGHDHDHHHGHHHHDEHDHCDHDHTHHH